MAKIIPAKRPDAGARRKSLFDVSGALLIALLCLSLAWAGPAISREAFSLPAPSLEGPTSVEEALKSRRTTRSFASGPLELSRLSQLLWAAYGVTAHRFGRDLKTAPSAGALYPLDVYAVVGERGVQGLDAGVYHFVPRGHRVELIKEGDIREELARACFRQTWIAGAPVVFVITGEYKRSTVKYGERGVAYTRIESGCVGQNIFLQAEALGLKAGIAGAFDDRGVMGALGVPEGRDPLLVMPVGPPAAD